MTGTFLATWIRLRRRPVLLGTMAATAAVTALSTTLAFVFADTPTDQRPGPSGGTGAAVTTASLSTAGGLLQGLSLTITLFGIIAFCLAAATFAGEYGTGTIRTMLLREPRRTQLILGTWAAVASFVAIAVLLAALVAAGTAVLLAPGQHVDTATWFSSNGFTTSARTTLRVLLACLGYTILGSSVGILTRAAIPAVVLGIGWLFLVETIVATTAARQGRWLPGQLLSAVATGGTPTMTFPAALLAAFAYLLAAAAAALTAFIRRDVTA